MDEILLSELIEQTKESIRSFKHSQSTLYQYQLAWKKLTAYFIENNQVLFSKQLAEQYVLESKAKLDTGDIKRWRYNLYRLTVRMLLRFIRMAISHGIVKNMAAQHIFTNRRTFSCKRIISTVSIKKEKPQVPYKLMK